jgi:hypothetical protein
MPGERGATMATGGSSVVSSWEKKSTGNFTSHCRAWLVAATSSAVAPYSSPYCGVAAGLPASSVPPPRGQIP